MENKSIDIILKSKVLKVIKINKKTKARLFKDLKVGDTIQLSVEAKVAGINYGTGNTHATYLTIENLETKETTGCSFNELKILDNFEFEKYERVRF